MPDHLSLKKALSYLRNYALTSLKTEITFERKAETIEESYAQHKPKMKCCCFKYDFMQQQKLVENL